MPVTKPFLMVAALLSSPLAKASVHFVAPWGTALGDGTSENPLELRAVLTSGSAKPGDSLILLGGTYHGAFVSNLTGEEGRPIVVRPAPRARARIDGNLTIQGAWVTYLGLEVTNSSLDRSKPRLPGVKVIAPHTRLINMIVHGGGDGIEFWTPAVDSEIYGCIIYDNGWQGPDPDRGHGHGIYTQNETGTKRIVDNIIFEGFGYGIHAYTEGGSLNGFHLEGNTIFNSGSATRQKYRYDNILIGGLRSASRIELVSNFTYHTPGAGGSNRLGYAAPNEDVTVRDNYFAGGSTVLGILSWEKIVMTGNIFAGLQNLVSLAWPKDSPALTHDVDNNAYLSGEGTTPFKYRNQSLDFQGWRRAGNIDEHSLSITTPAKRLEGVKIFVRRNRFEPGRAYITVYNWDREGNVEADLRDVLEVGSPYEVRNVLDLQGDAILSGTYSGGSISLPMTGFSTGPEFNVLVVDSSRRR